MTHIRKGRHLFIEIAFIVVFFNVSMCISNVNCPDKLELTIKSLNTQNIEPLKKNNSNGTINISNGVVISCISRFPVAFHFQGNSEPYLLDSQTKEECYYSTTLDANSIETGQYICSAMTLQGMQMATLVLDNSISGYASWRIIRNESEQLDSLVLHCPSRKPNSTLNACQQMYKYVYKGTADKENIKINYTINRYEELVNAHELKTVRCISHNVSQLPLLQKICEEYDTCSCTEVENMLQMGQRTCTRNIMLKCENRSDCELTPWRTFKNESIEFSQCKNAIYFTQYFNGDKYDGQIIDVTCKASKHIFSKDLKLFTIFDNNTIIEMHNFSSGVENITYIIATTFNISKQHKIKGLRCSAPYINSIGWQSQDTNEKSFNRIMDTTPPKFLNPDTERKYVARDGKDNITCNVIGEPKPYIGLFYANGTKLSNFADNVTFVNVNIASNVNRLVCKAYYVELKGFETANHTIELCFTKDCEKSTDKETSYSFAVIIVASVLITLAIIFWKKCKTKPVIVVPHQTIKHFFDGREIKNNEGQVDIEPYNRKDEIIQSEIKFGNRVGAGHFGDVYQATLTRLNKNGENEITSVAVKNAPIMVSAKDIGSHAETVKAEKKFKLFLKEVKILQAIKQNGGHENVVKYIGAMTKNIKHFDVNIVLEYCEAGDLNTFLNNNKTQFINKFGNSRIITREIHIGYSDIILASAKNFQPFDTDDLIRWSKEIASGMKYLNDLKVIHFDLAARNVLLAQVDDKLVSKINDFGLSTKINPERKLYYEIFGKDINWPWHPPDLKDGKITLNSDIWSYGVTVWEIFSLGEYPDEKLGKEAPPDKPMFANWAVHEIMLRCFNQRAEQRPSFSKLEKDFAGLEMALQNNQALYMDTSNDDVIQFGTSRNIFPCGVYYQSPVTGISNSHDYGYGSYMEHL